MTPDSKPAWIYPKNKNITFEKWEKQFTEWTIEQFDLKQKAIFDNVKRQRHIPAGSKPAKPNVARQWEGIDAMIQSAVINRSIKTLMMMAKDPEVLERILTNFVDPKRGRPPRSSALESAAIWLVDEIWLIWKQHYRGRWQRPDKLVYEITAQIAQDLGFRFTASQIELYRRKHGKKAPR